MTPPRRTPLVRDKVIGVAIVAGVLGLAVATREHLERVETHRIRDPSDVAALAAKLAVLVATCGTTAFALVRPTGTRAATWVDDLQNWCAEVGRHTGCTLTTYDPDALRRGIAGNAKHPSNWRLMAELAARHPAMRMHTRACLPASMPRYQVQKRERYWTPAFLALAA
ncbi:MAG: hypothetical protein ACOZNI_09875, partial [Myxococcota bacterium]